MRHITGIFFCGASLILSACSGGLSEDSSSPDSDVTVYAASDDAPKAKPRPDAEGADAVSATATDPKPSARPEQNLGTTIVSLGLLDRDGLWMKTPLVKSEAPGRVVYEKTGSSANVVLLPLDAEPGAGSQLSLSAMQVMGIPLADLAQVRVFVR